MASLPLKVVEEVIRKARRDGEASKDKYSAEYNESEGRLALFHYGTLIYASERGEPVALGGYSASDRDAINSALELDGVSWRVSKAKSYRGKAEVFDGWFVIPRGGF